MDQNKKLQLEVYVKKYFRVFLNSNGLLKIISTIVIMGLVLFSANEQSFSRYAETKTTVFAIVCACIWTGLFNSIELICSERNSIRQEHKSGDVEYPTFLQAHMIVELIVCFVEALITTAIVVILHGTRFEIAKNLDLARILFLFLGIFLIIYTSDVMGLMISAIVKTTKTAMTVMPFALIFQLVYAGVIFKLDNVKEVISKFTIARWGVNILGMAVDLNSMNTNLGEVEAKAKPRELVQAINNFLAKDSINDHNQYKATLGNIALVIGVFLAIIVVEYLIAVEAMKLIDRDTR